MFAMALLASDARFFVGLVVPFFSFTVPPLNG